MTKSKTSRGFEVVDFNDGYGLPCKLQQSSAIDENSDNGFNNPGSSYIWLGLDQKKIEENFALPINPTAMHLSRENVEDLIKELQEWLDTGSFLD